MNAAYAAKVYDEYLAAPESVPEEWVRWFPGDAPIGQGTLMPPLQRRAGFRISIGVIAEA